MSYCSLYVCHLSVFIPAEVSRQLQSPAECCEAVPEGLVKQDGWPSSPHDFPRWGRLLQLLIECGSTPLSGLCKRRFETLDETDFWGWNQEYSTAGVHECGLWFPQHIRNYVYCTLARHSLSFMGLSLSSVCREHSWLWQFSVWRKYKCIWAELFNCSNMNSNNKGQPRLDSDLKIHSVLLSKMSLFPSLNCCPV